MVKSEYPEKGDKYLYILFYFVFLCAFFICIFIIPLLKTSKSKQLYDEALLKYNNEVANYSYEFQRYIDEVFDFIHSLDKDYNIDKIGNIPVKVTINLKKRADSKYIGTDFSYKYSFNGQSVHSNSIVSINIFGGLEILTEIRERDPSSDDVGKDKNVLFINIPELNNGITVNQTIPVREHYGTNAGNEAVFDVTYYLKPTQVLPLSLTQVEAFPKRPLIPEKTEKKDYKASLSDIIEQYNIWLIVLGAVIIGICIIIIYNFFKSRAIYNSVKNDLLKQLSEKSIQEIAHVPDNVFFTDEDLPYTKSEEGKFGIYTLFISKTGHCYHAIKTCSKSLNLIEINCFSPSLKYNYQPCVKCAKGVILDKPEWYIKYLEIKDKCKYFKIL